MQRDLEFLSGSIGGRPRLLDVGGRKSPYTVGLRADITIVELPRVSAVQERLHLGWTESVMAEIRRRRSNITGLILEDMTQSTLPDGAFDGVISVEVIEHVPDDVAFVGQIARVCRSGGFAYFTTPNGDYIKNEPPHYNPDHIRHYTRDNLERLLSKDFSTVSVKYGVRTGKHRVRGIRGMSVKRPVRTMVAMISNLINRWESQGLDDSGQRTAHLFAICRK
ncbi:MAG: class I SAM-dependent methyltransferase [Verrucomicrobiae bacterium]|nr:class I SAM-dependent methyltransferase [Verrucomicrobiae bacterium]